MLGQRISTKRQRSKEVPKEITELKNTIPEVEKYTRGVQQWTR